MKKAISALAFVILCTCAFGQVVLTSSNYYIPGNVAHDIYMVENDMTDAIPLSSIVSNPFVLGNSLETQFSVYGITDTAVYNEPATEGEFIEETCSYADESEMTTHVKVTSENAVCLGISGALSQFGLDDNMELAFDEPLELILFPAQLNSQKNSTAHGQYLKHISSMQSTFNGMQYGQYIYQMLTAEYDSIKIDMNVTYTSNFDESGNITLSGNRMQQGTYEYIRETRQYAYVTNMYLHRLNSTEFTDINECTLTNPMLAMLTGGSTTINLGSALAEFMGMSFPMSSTSTTLNYWTANDNYPIVEMKTSNDASNVTKIVVRYGDNPNCVESQKISTSIYPNPTTDFLNIEIEEMTDGTISIYSVNGSLVKEEKINGTHNTINVSTLRNGNYFFRISCGDKEINGNFAKN
ncbi:MAG: T9SS type A sorting domain-containing protein [Bacteroidales bacterium]|nr:T9SS type A sorting domain-containing protein [Bacteroidales bacterium]